VEFQYRAIRGAASALLVAVAVGSAGMGGITSALAADPGTLVLTGTLIRTVDGTATPLPGIDLVLTETSAADDGGTAAFQVTTGADGSFAAEVFDWGTAELPATVTIAAAEDEFQIEDEACSHTWGLAIDPGQHIGLAGATPDPLTVSATITLLGEVCATTATPPANGPGNGPVPRAHVTPPPTDTLAAPVASRPDRLGPALTIGFVVGLLVAASLLLLRMRTRRRD
jgi:hypothetical protein